MALVAASCADGQRTVPVVSPSNGARTQIFAADGTLITTIASDENRETVSLDSVPLIMQNAVVSIEDERFWTHDGVDPKGILRALTRNSQSGATGQGGSTITQQLVKNTLLSREKTFARKFEEASLALQVERNYSKKFILEQYLNTVFFGNRAYGVQVAAKNYFGHGVDQVTLPEAAMLAGMIQSPVARDPYSHMDLATTRRNTVLRKMAELGYITNAQRDQAIATPITLVPRVADQPFQRYAAPHFVEEVKRFIRNDARFGATADERNDLLNNGGLKIYTTVDLTMQALAEAQLKTSFPNQALGITDPRKSPDAALVSIDPRTGYVKAMVGGYDYFDTNVSVHSYANYNLAVGKGRQVGSTFKPIALAAALTNGIKMSDTYSAPKDLTITMPGYAPWTLSGDPLGRASLTECTIESANTCFANLEADKRVGPARVTEYATKMGINTTYDPTTRCCFDTVPSEVLGANDNTVLDMTSAYTTFAARGIHVTPTLVTKVVGPNGDVIYQNVHQQTKVLEPAQADAITTALEGVLTRGTASGNGIGRPAAGKTGTTQDQTDAWFIGYTPDLVTGIWTGFATPIYDKASPNGRLRQVGKNGGRIAAPAWAAYMKQALAAYPPSPFGGPTDDPATGPAPTTTLKSNTAIFQPQKVPGTATMPDLTGKNITEALAAARSAGVRARRVDVDVPGALPGQVVGSSPPAGSKVTGGGAAVIESTPGIPPPRDPFPDLYGQVAADVAPPLTAKGWVVVQTAIAAPPGTLLANGLPPVPGQIWQTSPPPGTIVPDGHVFLNVQP